MKKILLIAIVLCGVFVSCKKSSTTAANNNSDTCSITEAHLQGSYITTDAYTSYLNLGDIYKSTNPLLASVIPSCRWDDIIYLNAGNVYIDSTTCSSSKNATGTWSIKSDSLIETASGSSDTAFINSFDCKTAVITYNNFKGTGAQVKITLTKQ